MIILENMFKLEYLGNDGNVNDDPLLEACIQLLQPKEDMASMEQSTGMHKHKYRERKRDRDRGRGRGRGRGRSSSDGKDSQKEEEKEEEKEGCEERGKVGGKKKETEGRGTEVLGIVKELVSKVEVEGLSLKEAKVKQTEDMKQSETETDHFNPEVTYDSSRTPQHDTPSPLPPLPTSMPSSTTPPTAPTVPSISPLLVPSTTVSSAASSTPTSSSFTTSTFPSSSPSSSSSRPPYFHPSKTPSLSPSSHKDPITQKGSLHYFTPTINGAETCNVNHTHSYAYIHTYHTYIIYIHIYTYIHSYDINLSNMLSNIIS